LMSEQHIQPYRIHQLERHLLMRLPWVTHEELLTTQLTSGYS
jgi:hypothetical protein